MREGPEHLAQLCSCRILDLLELAGSITGHVMRLPYFGSPAGLDLSGVPKQRRPLEQRLVEGRWHRQPLRELNANGVRHLNGVRVVRLPQAQNDCSHAAPQVSERRLVQLVALNVATPAAGEEVQYLRGTGWQELAFRK